VQPVFQIHLGSKDLELLKKIQLFFGVGKVSIGKDGSAIYYVNSIKELKNVVVPYFIKYPLITQKQGDFILFKMIIELMTNRKHLTIEGLNEIVRLRASMNLGLSDELTKSFLSVVPVDRPKVELTEVKDPRPPAPCKFAGGRGPRIKNARGLA
jgi:hypothetical protein